MIESQTQPKSIYINVPSVLLAFIIDISFIFIYSFIHIKYYGGKIFSVLIGIAGFFGSVFIEGVIISVIAQIVGRGSNWLIPFNLSFPGIFEETGRYLCFKFILNKDEKKNKSIGYGIGHGGIESFLIGISLLSLLMSKDNLIQQGAIKGNVTFGTLFFGVFERFNCVFIQISFSVIVFKAVKENNINYYILAIFLHDFVDFFAFLYQRKILGNIIVLELIICIFAAIFSRYAYKLYINLSDGEQKEKEKEKEKEENEEKQKMFALEDKKEEEV